MKRLAILVVAACSRPAAPPRAPAPSNHVEPARRDTPPPSIDWKDTRFAVHGLPAVAKGGELAVVAVEDSDAGRGFPNLRVEVRDRSDRVVETLPVMVSNEFERLVPDAQHATPELAKRIAAANGRLAALHDAHDLVPLQPLEVMKSDDDPHLARGDDLFVEWLGNRLLVGRQPAADAPVQHLASRDGTPWLAVQGRRCPQCPPCENPAYLAGAYHADVANTFMPVVVVEIGYRGTDTCWEPGHQWHVVAW
ncbi:MAG: hypothetical protein ACM31C_09230 [Acidobacteriota bacterium]